MNKNIQKQLAYTTQQNEELKKLLATVEEGSEAWHEYRQRIDENNLSMQDMKKTMAENAKAAASLAGEKASQKIEKQDSKTEMYDAQMDNAVTAKQQNKYINKKISSLNRQQDAYNTAVKTDKKNVSGAKKTLNSYKASKENKALLKQIQKYTKAGKRIPQSLLNKAYGLNDNGKLYSACVQYNAYLDSYASDKETADLFKQTSKQEKADLAMEKFNNISNEYDNKITKNEQKKTSLNNKIALAEERGRTQTTAYYKGLVSAETAEQNKLKKKKAALQKSLNEAVKNGSVKKNSEEWYEMTNAVYEVTNAINESTKSLAEYNNAIRQIRWDSFDRAMETVKRLNTEIKTYTELISSEKMTDRDGNFTEYAKASLALYHADYKNDLSQAEEYAREYQKLMASADLADQNVINRLRELEDAHWDAMSAAEGEKQSIIDLIREGYEAQLAALSRLIQKYKDLKQDEKNAYEYQKTIAEKTKNIAALQKQLQAYGENDTEEARAKIQKLKVELEEAREDLKETEYDKYFSDMNDMLDDLYNGYEEFIDEKLNDTNEILSGIKELIGDTNTVIGTLNERMAGISPDGHITQILNDILTGRRNPEDYAGSTVSKETKDVEKSSSTAGSQSTSHSEGTRMIQTESGNQRITAKTESVSDGRVITDSGLISKSLITDDLAGAKNTREPLKQLESILEDNSGLQAVQKKQAEQFIKANVQTADKKKERYSDVNQIIWENKAGIYKGTGKVLPADKLKALASLLGIEYNSASSKGNLYKKLKALGIKGYAKGSKHIQKDQAALLAEEGTELHYDKDEGVIQTVGSGDKVFTKEMTDNLWEQSKQPPQKSELSYAEYLTQDLIDKVNDSLQITPQEFYKLHENEIMNYTMNAGMTVPASKAPDINTTNNQTYGDVNVTFGDINLPNVQDQKDFARSVVGTIEDAFCNNRNFRKCAAESIGPIFLGKTGIGQARLYKM